MTNTQTILLYRRWIDDYVESVGGDVLQRCASATIEMQRDFPELKRVRGHVLVPTPDYPGGIKKWPHWWLETEDGILVDPTAAQFPEGCDYAPWDEAKGDPTGKCLDCGEYTFNGHSFCNDNCERAYRAYLGV